ncbi:unnamed protein product [Closterium sp. Naga37s-1]|nr:unnamed protein product [Closterium sp. Naga37s-1]
MGGAASRHVRVVKDAALWYSCAGPLVTVPAVGSLVVYFPQGHVEQQQRLAQADERTHELMVRFELQPVDEAEAVRAQAAASQEARRAGAAGRRGGRQGREGEKAGAQEAREEGGMDTDNGRTQAARPGGLQAQAAAVQGGVHTHMGAHAQLHMCCKRLSTSDAAPHGGFFIPRKAAESLFPALVSSPLDANEEGPCQQLVASDVFGREWNFRHVYRGSPRRHLLTAGWSALCASWGLAASDRIVFLRAGNGALKVGARRSEAVLAAQQRRQRERERGGGATDSASSAGAAKEGPSNSVAHATAAAGGGRGGGDAAAMMVTASEVLEWAAHCHGVKRAFSVVYHPWYPPSLLPSSHLPPPSSRPAPFPLLPFLCLP